jgi:hypothetical protein
MEREGDSGDIRSAFLQPKREDAASITARCKAAELNLTYRYHSTRIITECRRGGFQLIEEGKDELGRAAPQSVTMREISVDLAPSRIVRGLKPANL